MVVFSFSRGKINLAKTIIQTLPELVMYDMNKSSTGRQHVIISLMPIKTNMHQPLSI